MIRFSRIFCSNRAKVLMWSKLTNYRHLAVFKQTTPYEQHGSEWKIVGVEVPCLSYLSENCFVFQNAKKCMKYVRACCIQLLPAVRRCNLHVRPNWFLTPKIWLVNVTWKVCCLFRLIWPKMMERYSLNVGSHYGVQCSEALNGQCILWGDV